MGFSQWGQVALVCLLGAMSPGPSLAVVLRNTVAGGRLQGLLTGIGHGLGMLFYALVAVAGLVTLFQTIPHFFEVAQWLGATFLTWLGVQMIRGGWQELHAPSPVSLEAAAPPSGRRGFAEGFLIAFLNPKIAAWLLALFSQFVHPEASWNEQAVLVTTVGGIDMSWYSFVVIVASSGNWMERLRRNKPQLDLGMGALLLLLAFSMVARTLWGEA